MRVVVEGHLGHSHGRGPVRLGPARRLEEGGSGYGVAGGYGSHPGPDGRLRAMSRPKGTGDASDLDRQIAKITADTINDDDRYSAFRAALQAGTELPCGGIVIGEPVSVIAWDYDGNERRGVTTKCRKRKGRAQSTSSRPGKWRFPRLPEAPNSWPGAYRRWMGLEPYRDPARPAAVKRGSGEGESGEIEIGKPIDLVIVGAVKDRAAQCRVQGRDRSITLRTSEIEALVPGEIARVHPKKLWKYARGGMNTCRARSRRRGST